MFKRLYPETTLNLLLSSLVICDISFALIDEETLSLVFLDFPCLNSTQSFLLKAVYVDDPLSMAYLLAAFSVQFTAWRIASI